MDNGEDLHSQSIPEDPRNRAYESVQQVTLRLLAASIGIATALKPTSSIASDTSESTTPTRIDLNTNFPPVTDVCWLDVSHADGQGGNKIDRIEISLFGTVVPKTVANFKALCEANTNGGYGGSDIFRIITSFSIQGKR